MHWIDAKHQSLYGRTQQVSQSTSQSAMKTVNQNRKGIVTVLFAIMLPVIIVILGFSLDYAHMQRTRNELRVIADLSAKAAADTLARTGGDVDAARDAAKDVALANDVAGVPLTLEDDQITFGRAMKNAGGKWIFTASNIPPFNSVQVDAARDAASTDGPVNLFFGPFYGNSGFESFQSATASFRDLEVVLVLDRSGSMKYNINLDTMDDVAKQNTVCDTPKNSSRWTALDSAVNLFLDELDATPVQERIGLVTFASVSSDSCGGVFTGSDATLDAPLTTSTTTIRNTMQTYGTTIWNGGTNIEAGLRLGRQHFESNGTVANNKVIIVLTDGKFNQGSHPDAEAALCQAAGITVHAITFSQEANQEDMILVANAASGEHYYAPDRKTLENVFRRLVGTFAILTE